MLLSSYNLIGNRAVTSCAETGEEEYAPDRQIVGSRFHRKCMVVFQEKMNAEPREEP